MNMTNNNNYFEVDGTPKPLRIFTVSHAVRPPKKIFVENEQRTNKPVILNEKKINKSLNNNISQQIKETLEIKYKATTNYQLRSTLPLNMIVSKMATRKLVQGSNQENEDPHGNLDISMCRKFKLAPPSWRNKPRPNQTKRLKHSCFKQIVDSMKEKCSQSNCNMEQDSSIYSGDRRHSDLNQLLVNVGGSDCDKNCTPSKLNYNYKQLYGKQHGQRAPVQCADEDPLPDDFECQDSESRSVELSAIQTHSTPPEKFEFNPRYSPRPHEPAELFLWNPIIVTEPNKRLFSPVRERTREYHHPHFEYVNETSWRPPSHGNCYDTTNRWLPSCHDSPYSPVCCETSSTSSGQTIAEESLQFTYYATRGRVSQFDCSLHEQAED